jgi:hypothetical protein
MFREISLKGTGRVERRKSIIKRETLTFDLFCKTTPFAPGLLNAALCLEPAHPW